MKPLSRAVPGRRQPILATLPRCQSAGGLFRRFRVRCWRQALDADAARHISSSSDGGVIDNMGLDWFFNGGGAGASPLMAREQLQRTGSSSDAVRGRQRWFATSHLAARSEAAPFRIISARTEPAPGAPAAFSRRPGSPVSATPDRSGAIIRIRRQSGSYPAFWRLRDPRVDCGGRSSCSDR